MANNITETLVGAVVVATAVGFVIYAGQSTGFSGGADEITLQARFTTAEGLNVGDEVRLAGVKVGTLTGLRLDRQTYQAVAEFSVRNDVLIPEDSEAKVASEGLLGGSFLELTPGGADINLLDGEEVIYTQGSLSLINLLMKFVTKPDENPPQ